MDKKMYLLAGDDITASRSLVRLNVVPKNCTIVKSLDELMALNEKEEYIFVTDTPETIGEMAQMRSYLRTMSYPVFTSHIHVDQARSSHQSVMNSLINELWTQNWLMMDAKERNSNANRVLRNRIGGPIEVYVQMMRNDQRIIPNNEFTYGLFIFNGWYK